MKIHRVLISVLMLALLSCASESDKKSSDKKTIDTTGKWDKASCDILPGTGASADLRLAQEEVVETGAFGKTYNASWLRGVSDISGHETVEFIRQTSTQVFKIPTTGSGCPFYGGLTVTPSDLQAIWRQAEPQEETSVLLGVYLPANPKTASVAAQPAIMLLEQTSRYTAVHEFMHHNFYTRRVKETGVSDHEIKSRAEQLSQSVETYLKTYEQSASRADGEKAAEVIWSLVEALDEIRVRYTLEEVSIESLLGEKYERRELKNVPYDSYISGGYYIRGSADSYYSFMNSIEAALGRLSNYFQPHPDLLQDLKSKFSRLYQNRKAETSELVRRAQYRKYTGNNLVGSMVLHGAHALGACPHALAGERATQRALRQLERL